MVPEVSKLVKTFMNAPQERELHVIRECCPMPREGETPRQELGAIWGVVVCIMLDEVATHQPLNDGMGQICFSA